MLGIQKRPQEASFHQSLPVYFARGIYYRVYDAVSLPHENANSRLIRGASHESIAAEPGVTDIPGEVVLNGQETNPCEGFVIVVKQVAHILFRFDKPDWLPRDQLACRIGCKPAKDALVSNLRSLSTISLDGCHRLC